MTDPVLEALQRRTTKMPFVVAQLDIHLLGTYSVMRDTQEVFYGTAAEVDAFLTGFKLGTT